MSAQASDVISEPVPGRLTPAAESALRTLVRGAVRTDGDTGYEDAIALHNGAIVRRPAALVQVSGVGDVVLAIRFARREELSISVRGGGHGVAGHALGGDLVIDLSALRGVRVDPVACTAVVQGGATWADVDAATQAHGLAVPGGRISHTGVAGMTLGGGEGWLSVRHGLTADNLLAVEMVTADGRVVHADAGEAPELFWALRGGGGNFGVVTSFTFRLHPVGPTVVGGMLGYPISAAHDVFATLAQLHASAPDEFGGAASFLTAPPAPFVPGNVVGRPMLAVLPVWFGAADAAAALIRPLRERVRPLVDHVGPMPYLVLQSMLDEQAPRGLRNRWTSGFVPELGSDLITALQDAATRLPSPLSQIAICPLPDAVRRVDEDSTAFPARSGGRWLVHAIAAWPDPAGDEAAAAWVADVAATVRAHGQTGSYLNLGEDDDDHVRSAMGAARYSRLQQVKLAWDPEDVFRHCAHVQVPG